MANNQYTSNKPLVLSSDTLKTMQDTERENLYEQYCEHFESIGISSDAILCFAQLANLIFYSELKKSSNLKSN